MSALRNVTRLLAVPSYLTMRHLSMGCLLMGCLFTFGCTQTKPDWNDQPMPEKPDCTPQLGEFKSHALEREGQTFRYVVYVPPAYTPDEPCPALLFLHGSGERGSDGVKQATVGLGNAIRAHPERFPCIAIMPQCPGGLRWEGAMEAVALDILGECKLNYQIDPDRIVLTGLSLGGFGTWAIGSKDADPFAAFVPVCGGGDPENVGQLTTRPIWCFHGGDDSVVPVERSREMVEAIRAADGNIRYTEYPGVNHNSWDPTYNDAEVIAWMLAQQR